MTLTRLHLSLALLLAAGAHGALIAWLSLPAPPSLPEPEAPLQLSLAPVAQQTQRASAPTPPPRPRPRPNPEPPPNPQPAPKPLPEPEPIAEPQPLPEPEPESPPQVEEVPPEPTPEPPPEPVTEPPPVSEPPPLAVPTEVAPAPDSQASIRYEQLLVAWLERHKRYPRRAKRLRIEGEGQLHIVIDRQGKVLQVELSQDFGHRLLNKAALAMVRRADPFPPMPEDDPRARFEFQVPVAFRLQ